jgi:tetratricopeptide (TPR) repeat protein
MNIRTAEGKNALALLLARLQQARATNDNKQILEVGSEVASIFAINGEWEEVEKYLLVCLQAAEQASDASVSSSYIYSIRRSLAQAYRKLGEHEKGIAVLEEDRAFFESRGNNAQLANIHFQLSNHYKELGEKSKALDHLRKSYQLYVSIGDAKNAKAIQRFIEALKAER